MRWSKFPELVEKEQSNLPSTGLIINGAVWVKQGSNGSEYISEKKKKKKKKNRTRCNTQLELSVYNMWCSYMVLPNPHMKPRIEFTIMKIYMKIVKKSVQSHPGLRVFDKLLFDDMHNITMSITVLQK